MSEGTQIVAKYSCSQLFGYKSKSEKLLEQDNITTLKFDPSGKFLALGDKAGRLIIFHSEQQIGHTPEYDYFYEFEAHRPEFDTLKSTHLSESVQHIGWMRPQGKYLRLLTSNTHTVKLWRLFQRQQKHLVRGSSVQLQMPHLQEQESSVCVTLRNSFSNQSYSPLNSMGLSSNEQYLYTTDENSMLLWNLQRNKGNKPFLLYELKKMNNKKLDKSEKITCANLHPQIQTMFALGTNKGNLSFVDSRVSYSDPHILDFKCHNMEGSYIDQIIKQYTSVRFLSDNRKIVTRDLATVKVWDMCSNREPLLNIPIDECIKSELSELFQAQQLGDKFSLTEARGNIVTGNYSNSFQIMDPNSGENVQYELDFGQDTIARRVGDGKRTNPFSCSSKVQGHDFNSETGQLAVSTSSCFFIFSQDQQT